MTPFRVSTLNEEKGGLFMEFEWDRNKAAANLSKHDVSFDEAKTVFNDPFYVDFYDIDHSDIDCLIYGTRICHSIN
jgi:hypothetical protein